MKLEAIKLNFISPVHFGRGREELDKTELVYHSDSMKSAIYAVGIRYYPEWSDAEKFFNGFRISSCFPFAGDELFLPRPMINKKFTFRGKNDYESIKDAKKVEFLSKEVFERYIDASVDSLEVEEDLITPDKAFICSKKETCLVKDNAGQQVKRRFYHEAVQQRVSVPIEGEEGQTRPFYVDRIYFEPDCGLFFLAEFHDNGLRSQIMKIIRLLGESGIGTDRTVGNGLFLFDENRDVIKDITFSTQGSELQIPLGLYLPLEDELKEIDLDNSYWGWYKRGGYIGGSENEEIAHLRKKSIFMFSEGSVFTGKHKLTGKYVDLKPEWGHPIHPVWRCGMPIFINA